MNLAARLEAHTKKAGRPVLLDAAARAALGAGFAVDTLQALGEVLLPGFRQPVGVFALAVPPATHET